MTQSFSQDAGKIRHTFHLHPEPANERDEHYDMNRKHRQRQARQKAATETFRQHDRQVSPPVGPLTPNQQQFVTHLKALVKIVAIQQMGALSVNVLVDTPEARELRVIGMAACVLGTTNDRAWFNDAMKQDAHELKFLGDIIRRDETPPLKPPSLQPQDSATRPPETLSATPAFPENRGTSAQAGETP